MTLLFLLPLFIKIKIVSIEYLRLFVGSVYILTGLISFAEGYVSDSPIDRSPCWRKIICGMYILTEIPYSCLMWLGHDLQLWVRIALLIVGDILIRFPDYADRCEDIVDYFDRRKLDNEMRDKMMHLQTLSQKSRTNDEKLSEVKKAVEDVLKTPGGL